jgi:DNA ligase-associated metallophosphoesterase
MTDARLEIRGETLTLLPERCAFWHRESMLLVADPHWGKAATFRAGGIPVPSGTTREAIARLESAVTRINPQRIAFLGDLLHAAEGRNESLFSALAEWRQTRAEVSITLVRGNHDRRAGDPPASLDFDCVDAPHAIAPFVLAHYPADDPNGYVLSGHVHPGVWIPYAGKVPCFSFGKSCGILPAFGDFTGLALVAEADEQMIFAVADNEVCRVR